MRQEVAEGDLGSDSISARGYNVNGHVQRHQLFKSLCRSLVNHMQSFSTVVGDRNGLLL